jgi:hypothetical protein
MLDMQVIKAGCLKFEEPRDHLHIEHESASCGCCVAYPVR